MPEYEKTKYKNIWSYKDSDGKTRYRINMGYPDGSIRELDGQESLKKAIEVHNQWIKEREIAELQGIEDPQDEEYSDDYYDYEAYAWEKQIGINIKKFRELHGLTVREFAKLLDLSPSYITMIEKGQRRLSINKLYRMSHTFHVKIDKLFQGLPPDDRRKKKE